MPWPKLLTAVDMPSLAPWRKARTQHIWDGGWEQMVFIQGHDCFDLIRLVWRHNCRQMKIKMMGFCECSHFLGVRFRFLCATQINLGPKVWPVWSLDQHLKHIPSNDSSQQSELSTAKKNTNNHVLRAGCYKGSRLQDVYKRKYL